MKRTLRLQIALVCLAGCAPAVAQDDAAEEQVLLRLESRPGEELRALPLDLARAFLRFDAAFFESHLDPEPLRRLDRAFDAATQAFMQGQLDVGVRELDEVWTSTVGETSPQARLLASLRLGLDPHVLQAGRDEELRLRLQSVYHVELDSETLAVPARVRLLDAGGRSREELDLQLVLDASGSIDVVLPLRVPADLELPAVLTVELCGRRGTSQGRASIAVLPESRQAMLADWRSRAAQLELRDERAEAGQVFLDRCERFALPFEVGHERAFLQDLAGLARELDAEIATLETGGDPYSMRPGDLWRTWALGEYRSPLRCFFPTLGSTGAAQADSLPLVIALHGAGTSEDFWFEAIGAPLIELARQHGFLVAAPRSSDLMARPQAIEALIDELQRVYPINPEQILLLGHSMGGMAAARIQATGTTRVFGAACIAGAAPFSDGAPALVLAGEIDPIVPRGQLEGLVAEAKQAGKPVRLQMFPQQGHTLLLRDGIEHALREFGLVAADPVKRAKPESEQESGR